MTARSSSVGFIKHQSTLEKDPRFMEQLSIIDNDCRRASTTLDIPMIGDSSSSSSRGNPTIQQQQRPEGTSSFSSISTEGTSTSPENSLCHVVSAPIIDTSQHHSARTSVSSDHGMLFTPTTTAIRPHSEIILPHHHHHHQQQQERSTWKRKSSTFFITRLLRRWSYHTSSDIQLMGNHRYIGRLVDRYGDYVKPDRRGSTTHKSMGATSHKNIASGATAVIRLVRSLNGDSILAVKEFKRRGKDENVKEYMKRMHNEYCISKTVSNHRNVVKTLDLVLDEQNRWCTIMEYVSNLF